MWFKRYTQKMPLLSYTNPHHDVADVVNYRMVKNSTIWIAWEWNITFLQNKKILNMCLIWNILRSYCFVALHIDWLHYKWFLKFLDNFISKKLLGWLIPNKVQSRFWKIYFGEKYYIFIDLMKIRLELKCSIFNVSLNYCFEKMSCIYFNWKATHFVIAKFFLLPCLLFYQHVGSVTRRLDYAELFI